MGLKDWLAQNAMGASGYGEVMGREAMKNGIALGQTLYIGHGTCAKRSDAVVFEDSEALRSAGYELYCPDALHKPPMEDSSELSKNTRACGIAFAIQCCLTAAQNFMQAKNANAFNRSMGSATNDELRRLRQGITAEMILQYLKLSVPAGVTQVLNLSAPGSDDFLSVYLQALNNQNDGRVAFQQTGILGFGTIAVPLAEETVKSIRMASHKFGW